MIRHIAACTILLWASAADAQTISHRGFVEGRMFGFPETAPNDDTRGIGDILVREEVFLQPAEWLQLAAGFDYRANSDGQVEDEWHLDLTDRTVRRPRVAVRRLTASIVAGGFALDVGKQFIRWGRADVMNPTDRFAPRDFLNVIDTDLLPVLAVRPSIQFAQETFEAVWTPRFTPSRLPLFSQRWAAPPVDAAAVPIQDGGAYIPQRSQYGVRWSHAGDRVESSLSYFDGYNHLPNVEWRALDSPVAVEVTRVYPSLRSYGGDLAIPTGLFTLKGEAAYFTSPASTSEEYVLYVMQLERQIGEWVLVGGYAGEVITKASDAFSFAPDRGMARSIVGRASYTVNPRRTVAIEGAVGQTRRGFYVKSDYSEAVGQHWRLTITGVAVEGDDDDFLGQYHRNSHGSVAFRFSF